MRTLLAAPPRTSLKPDTYVKMGVLKEEAADDADRLQPERDALRHEARVSYQKALELSQQEPEWRYLRRRLAEVAR